MLFELFTTIEDLSPFKTPGLSVSKSLLRMPRELVDFSRNLAYPRAGSKTNDSGRIKVGTDSQIPQDKARVARSVQ